MAESSYILCAAIDFGTTYSGYAFSTRHDFDADPLKVAACQWTAGSSNVMSLKTPTTVLFNPDRKFDSFGFEAEDRYCQLMDDGQHQEWYYFRRFKMRLFNSKDVHRSSMLADENGKDMPAMDVFTAAIRFMKDHLMRTVGHRMHGIVEADIRWVLTVPAIWDDAAKQFMREAAEKGGIPGRALMLSLEPEAASMYCRYLPLERIKGTGNTTISCFQPGSKYMVLDAGGGTVDITIHEVSKDGSLRELCPASGGPWGGTTVDLAFLDFLQSITGPKVMERFRKECQDDYVDLLREFEVKKRMVSPSLDARTTYRIPISLFDIFRDMEDKEFKDAVRERRELAEQVSFIGDKMRLEPIAAKSFFKNTTEKIVDHLKHLFSDSKAGEASSILMVGGFSESQMLCDVVQKAFPDKRVIMPSEAGLAVLKGAVIFGHNSSVIKSRIAKHTYGLKMYKNYDPKVHPKERAFIDENNRPTVRGCFDKLAEIGQSVSPDEPAATKTYHPTSGCSAFIVKLFASPEKNPMFVDDPGCVLIGEMSVDCLDAKGRVGSAAVSLIFGGTELMVHAVNNKTGEETKASFDFLQ